MTGRYFYRNPGGNMTGKWERVDLGLNVDSMLLVDVDGDGQLDVIAEALPDVYWLKPLDKEGNNWRAMKVASISSGVTCQRSGLRTGPTGSWKTSSNCIVRGRPVLHFDPGRSDKNPLARNAHCGGCHRRRHRHR